MTTDWLTAVAILAAGVIVGLMFIFFVRRKRAVQTNLEAKRDALVQRLREPGLAPEERTRLELEAANVLREIDEVPPPVDGGRERPLHGAFVGFAAGVVSTLLVVGLVYFVMHSAKPKVEQPAAVVTDPVQQLEAAVQKSPNDLTARVALAKAYLDRNNLMGVFDQTQYVLAKSPNDSRALTYQAVVRMAMGQREDAVKMLDKATKADPNLVDAWVATAWVKTQEGKAKDAQAAISEAARRHPEEKQRLDDVYAQMKQQASGPPPADLPPGHPPIEKSASSGEDGVQIVLDLDPLAKSKSGVVFVLARQEGVSAGPPVAVKRLQADSFPMTFVMTAADSMMGQPLPAKMRIEARLDADGDVVTKNRGEPFGVRDGVVSGSTISLALK